MKLSCISWKIWAVIVFCIVGIAAAIYVPKLFQKKTPQQGKYRYQITAGEGAIDFPWEYKTYGEKFPILFFDGHSYQIKSQDVISEAYLGESLGEARCEGTDDYTGETHTEALQIRLIQGVSRECLIAAGVDSEFYVYSNQDAVKPQTFGQLMSQYDLSANLRFDQFSDCQGYLENAQYQLADDEYIWEILGSCAAAVLCGEEQSFDLSSRNYLSFTATSAALGVYKRVVYLSEDGYFATNIFDYSYVYKIGEDAAKAIIDYARSSSVEAEAEPFEWSVSGTLTEIGEGFILVDDTVLCRNESDGTVYKILTIPMKIRRYIEFGGIKVGDTVVVTYREKSEDSNEIRDAYAIYPGILIDYDVAIQE